MPRVLKDPLVVFLIFGAALFLVAEFASEPEIGYEINITSGHQQRLAEQWALQMRRAPTTAELEGLIEQYIREEIYYREAQRLNLDENDTIVRRRMVQKLTFRTEDIATAVPLTDEELRASLSSAPGCIPAARALLVRTHLFLFGPPQRRAGRCPGVSGKLTAAGRPVHVAETLSAALGA